MQLTSNDPKDNTHPLPIPNFLKEFGDPVGAIIVELEYLTGMVISIYDPNEKSKNVENS